MKINRRSRSEAAFASAAKAGASQSGSRKAKLTVVKPADAIDKVSLSGLGRAIAAAQEDSPERIAHLQKLRAEFETGRYTVDSTALVQRVIDDSIKR